MSEHGSSNFLLCRDHIPIELLDRIIDLAHDDKQALLLLGWVSKTALYMSRRHLFSTLELTETKLDKFFEIMDVSWTSLTSVVERIHLKGIFDKWGHEYNTERNFSRITNNLHNVKVLRFMPLDSWVIAWHYVSDVVLDFIFNLAIQRLEIFSTAFLRPDHVGKLFARLRPDTALILADVTGDKMPRSGSSAFNAPYERPLRFDVLDSNSLELWKNVWAEFPEHALANKTVQTFIVHPYTRRLSDQNQNNRNFLSKFLQQVGPSIERLLIDLKCYDYAFRRRFDEDELDIALDLSKCNNLRNIFIGFIDLIHQKKRLESEIMDRVLPLLEQDWNAQDIKDFRVRERSRDGSIRLFCPSFVINMLSALPSPDRLQEISLGFSVREQSVSRTTYPWPDFVQQLHNMFPGLKAINILFSIEDSELDMGAFGGDCLRKLMEEGKLRLDVVGGDVQMLKSPWREMVDL